MEPDGQSRERTRQGREGVVGQLMIARLRDWTVIEGLEGGRSQN